ncbi:MAG TPA: TIGR03435 family protein [Bryobacteraceae bacterium]|jgi:uncharacterized protein (TIGR03435 family)
MKKLLPWIALVVLQGGALFAQNLAGAWQGLMLVSQTPGDTLHVVFRISTAVGGALTGTMYSIDQGGQAPAPDVTLKGSAVKLVMPGIGATYTGNLTGDGNAITGKWSSTTGGGAPLTLNLTRATAETAWKIPEPPPPPHMMPPDANPAFEVVSVKPSNPDQRNSGIQIQGRQFRATNLTVNDLIRSAYGIHPRQLIGAPDWIEKDRYDILGKPDVEGQPNRRQMQVLIQKVLADRFGLKFHREKRELSAYTLVIGKTGAKLTAAEGDPKADPQIFFYGPGKFVAKNATLADFAEFLQGRVVDRPVVDQTGLAGRYDFGIIYRSNEPLAGGRGDNPAIPGDLDALQDIYGAVPQQLGLRLESTKTQVEMFVIDRLEKPSEN